MTDLHLLLGNKNYSSWSMRPWLALRYHGIPFAETVVPLYGDDDYKEKILAWSPASKVPVLKDDDARVWESLAILEHLAERFPKAELWPTEAALRAEARSVSAEMHAGFAALRKEQPMNLRRRVPGLTFSADCRADIARIDTIWSDCRRRYGAAGPFLFGQFTIADVMYAPVATRFKTYDIDVSPAAADYMETILNLPAVREWYAAAAKEPWTISRVEL